MFHRRHDESQVQAGSLFKYVHDGSNCAELAEVISVRDDQFGIPHVRFKLSYMIAERAEDQGTRTLAVTAFARRFDSLIGSSQSVAA
jgi:hypothetical protein